MGTGKGTAAGKQGASGGGGGKKEGAKGAAGGGAGITPEAIRREVEGALLEVLGSSLGPNEPLMSGGAQQ